MYTINNMLIRNTYKWVNNVNKYKKMLDFIALETYNCNAEVILYEVYFGSIKEDIYALFI